MSVKSDEVMVRTEESKISEPTQIGSILYDNDTTKNAERVLELKDKPVEAMTTEELRYMAPFVCPAKTEYDIRKNPYIAELCRRAGTIKSFLSEDVSAQKEAVNTAYKKFGSCLMPRRQKKSR